MEAAEIPVYSLSGILDMNEGWLARFLKRLAIPESDDAVGQIALALDSLGKLTYLPPINGDNLRELIKLTTPAEITRTKEVVRAAGVTPSVNRLELMKQYLYYATVPLAESPRFLPLERPISPRLSIIRPTSPRTSVSVGFEAIPEAQRGEFVALVNLLNNFPSETIQQIVKHYSYPRIQKICEIIAKVLVNKDVKLSSVLTNKLRNLNELLCDSQFFWRLKTQHDFEVTYDTPPDGRSWKQDYEFRLQVLQSEFFKAVVNDNKSRVEELLNFGVDPNAQEQFGVTALIHVSMNGQLEIARLLLEHGAKLDIQSRVGTTALINASRFNHKDIVRLLLEHGADPNIQDNKGNTALIIASNEGHDKIIQMLLGTNVDLNIRDKFENTALILASFHGYDDIVRILLVAGADFTLQNDQGYTALMLASDRGRDKIVRMLLDAGAEPNTQNNEGLTALMLAFDGSYDKIAQMLIDTGAKRID